MRFILLLLPFLFKLSNCNDYGKSSTLSKDQLAALPIPDLAPYDTTSDPLSALDPTQKIYVQSIFSKSIYNQKCEKPIKPIIQPIYFWPGKRVDLECKVCHRSHLYNSLVKHWAVLREDVSHYVLKLSDSLKTNKWEIITQTFADNLVDPQAFPPSMPQKSENIHRQVYRPRTQFFQRDGKLIILHPHADSYGLYRCFDSESKNSINFAYLLIPITPLFTMHKWKLHLGQCLSGAQPKLMFRNLDEFHQFHFLPAILPKTNNICPGFVDGEPEGYCSVDNFYESSQPPLDRLIDVSQGEDDKLIAKQTNLKIFVSWSNWSSCSNGETLKTRYGYCHIGQRDPAKSYGTIFSIAESLKIIHHLIDAVDEFKVNGIRLFSGVLADLLKIYPFNQCNDYKSGEWPVIEESIIKLIKASVNDTLDSIRDEFQYPEDIKLLESVCLRNFHGMADVNLEYGQKIIQNVPC